MNADASREGFRVLRKEPPLFLLELLWRWSFGLGVLALLFFAYAHLRQAILLSDADELALQSQDPMMLAETASAVLASTMPLLLRTLAQVFGIGAVLWIAAAALGRGAITRVIVRRLASDCGVPIASDAPRWRSYAILNFARVLMLLILVIGYLSGVLIAGLVNGSGKNVLISAIVVFLSLAASGVLWAYVNQVLSLAPIFVARDSFAPLDAVVEAIAFIRRQYSRIFAIAIWNGTIRGLAATLITIAGISTAASYSTLPAWSITVLLTVETLLYFVISDVLLLARFAAYASVAIRELILSQELTAQPNGSGTTTT